MYQSWTVSFSKNFEDNKISKGLLEAVNQSTNNTTAKRRTKTIIYKSLHRKTKDWETRTTIKSGASEGYTIIQLCRLLGLQMSHHLFLLYY
jgi:hypothetical protein